MGEAVVEAGGIVYALDRLPEPSDDFLAAQNRIDPATTAGSLHYRRVDVSNNKDLNDVITSTADEHGKLNGAIAAAGIQQLTPAIDYTPADAARMLQVNYTGVLMTAQACARSILKHKTPDASLVLIASMSGLIANKGLLSPVYNSSKAAVIQLARNLAMEWSKPRDDDGVPGIRVNCLSPGHIVTPMVERNFEEVEGLREMWEEANMMGRLSRPQEFGGAGVFLLGRASSFMTGSNLVIDGGHTAW
ncbi:NAD(P)-binding protein [Tothia fuscella]|uniref:NAD(P)-binding protein n=1 Tax=Tothia fuscella TaxID=1048955 RepID=A0A9P4P1N9_9PEZI|nr:NAD(P)-binding protein [Tothia fuscella]